MGQIKSALLLDGVIATGEGAAFRPLAANKTFQLFGTTSAGAGAATVEVQGSNDGVDWTVLDTLILTLATTQSSDFGVNAEPWKYVRGEVTAISGTDGTVSLEMGLDVA